MVFFLFLFTPIANNEMRIKNEPVKVNGLYKWPIILITVNHSIWWPTYVLSNYPALRFVWCYFTFAQNIIYNTNGLSRQKKQQQTTAKVIIIYMFSLFTWVWCVPCENEYGGCQIIDPRLIWERFRRILTLAYRIHFDQNNQRY